MVDLTLDTLQGRLNPSHEGRSPVGISVLLGRRVLLEKVFYAWLDRKPGGMWLLRAGGFMYNKLTANKFIKLNNLNFHNVCVHLRE